jgi:hypothetical protein
MRQVYQKKNILYNNMKASFLRIKGMRFPVAIGLAFGPLVQVHAQPGVAANSALNLSTTTPSLLLTVLALVLLGFGALVYHANIRR